MNKALKAALLSALVIPGLGHFFLKKHLVGTILLSVTLISLGIIIVQVLVSAQQISENILNGSMQLDPIALTELINQQAAAADNTLLNLAWYALFISWIIGILDSYRVGSDGDKV